MREELAVQAVRFKATSAEARGYQNIIEQLKAEEAALVQEQRALNAATESGATSFAGHARAANIARNSLVGLAAQAVGTTSQIGRLAESALLFGAGSTGVLIGARAELVAVTAEVMLIVRQLDALNRFRFRKDAESLAAWKSARDVAWPAEKEETPVGGDAQKPAA